MDTDSPDAPDETVQPHVDVATHLSFREPPPAAAAGEAERAEEGEPRPAAE